MPRTSGKGLTPRGVLLKPVYALVPAGGVGTRMGADRPKQYLALGAHTLLEHAVHRLQADARVQRVFVVVAPDDRHAATLALPARCEVLHIAAQTRAGTVANGLRALQSLVDREAGILVHDAARPCLAATDLAALIDAGGQDEHGALLATPISDTVKRGEGGRVVQTVERAGLWRALTPQYFRLDVLLRALGKATAAAFTDEASAVESLGLQPRLVPGASSNIKVTTPDDLLLAQALLRAQGLW